MIFADICELQTKLSVEKRRRTGAEDDLASEKRVRDEAAERALRAEQQVRNLEQETILGKRARDEAAERAEGGSSTLEDRCYIDFKSSN